MGTTTRPFIGINTDFYPTSKTYPAFIRLPARYFDAVYSAGGQPLLIPPVGKESELETILDRLDGIVFVGGLDMDPRRSGLPGHPALQPMSERRELFDRALMQLVIKRKLPTLAIGVGMQMLNVSLGGSLYMHLPEEMPRAMPHYDPSEGPHRHLVMLEPNTRFEEIYGAGELRVNSMHHQAVKTLGKGLRVGAKSPDEVIEGIEIVDPQWFCVGTQWHPECETASALDMQIFEALIAAASGRPIASFNPTPRAAGQPKLRVVHSDAGAKPAKPYTRPADTAKARRG